MVQVYWYEWTAMEDDGAVRGVGLSRELRLLHYRIEKIAVAKCHVAEGHKGRVLHDYHKRREGHEGGL